MKTEEDDESELNFLNKIRIKETSFEEDYSSDYYFLSLRYYEFNTMIFSLICNISFEFWAIGSGLLYHQFKTYNLNYYQQDIEKINIAKTVSLIMVSVSNIFFSI